VCLRGGGGSFECYERKKSRGSAVGKATGNGLDDRGFGVLAPLMLTIYTPQYRPDRLWGPPSLPLNGYVDSLLGDKAAKA
jgi:hypothetical protein